MSISPNVERLADILDYAHPIGGMNEVIAALAPHVDRCDVADAAEAFLVHFDRRAGQDPDQAVADFAPLLALAPAIVAALPDYAHILEPHLPSTGPWLNVSTG